MLLNARQIERGMGKERIILLAMEDITERQIEESLRQSEERYRTIITSMEDGYLETDLAGNFTVVNDAGCRNLGYSREELLRMNSRQITDEVNHKKIYLLFNKVYSNR